MQWPFKVESRTFLNLSCDKDAMRLWSGGKAHAISQLVVGTTFILEPTGVLSGILLIR